MHLFFIFNTACASWHVLSLLLLKGWIQKFEVEVYKNVQAAGLEIK
jgi:hypothetical protein